MVKKNKIQISYKLFYVFTAILFGGFLFGVAITFFSYSSYESTYTKVPEMHENYSITEQDVLEECGNYSNYEYLLCLNEIFKTNVNFSEKDCSNRPDVYSALEVLNKGQGCCRDSVEFYSYFLSKKNISSQKVFLPKDNPSHVFLIATFQTNKSEMYYMIVDFDKIIW